MSVRAIVTLGLALVFGISAAVLIRQAMFPRITAAQGSVAMVDVVVAKSKVGRGKPLSTELLSTQAIPKDTVPEGVFLATELESLTGQVARVDLEAGEQIFKSKVASRVSLSSEISPGMLAFTISTPSASSSNAGLLQPEDRVNVIFAPSGGQAGTSTATLLNGMRIIAINREYLQRSPDDTSDFEQVLSVTLEVTKDQSELLSWSQSRGTLSLALLSRDGTDSVTAQDLTIADLQQNLEGSSPPSQTKLDKASTDPVGVTLLVPARAIAAGEQISQDTLMSVVRPAEEVPEGALLQVDMEEVLGKQPLVALVRGEPLFESRFSQRRGSLSEFVSPGKRAYRIKSDAGRLVAEDRVDVVLTPQDTEGYAALTLMTAIRVIVVNDQPEGTNKPMEAYESATTVVLDVTPQEVELLSWAQRHGTITFAVVPNLEETDSQPSMTLSELKDRVLGKSEVPAVVPPEPVVSQGSGGVKVMVNELRNRAFGQTELTLYP